MPNLTLIRLLDSITLYLGERTHYPAVQTRILSVGPADFVPADATDFTVNATNTTNLTAGDVSFYMFASVRLPHGCRVSQLTLWSRTSDSTTNGMLDCNLLRRDFSDGTIDAMATVDDDVGGGAILSNVDSTIVNAVVDNEKYSYFLVVHFDSNVSTIAGDMDFIGFEIEYDTYRILDDGTFS